MHGHIIETDSGSQVCICVATIPCVETHTAQYVHVLLLLFFFLLSRKTEIHEYDGNHWVSSSGRKRFVHANLYVLSFWAKFWNRKVNYKQFAWDAWAGMKANLKFHLRVAIYTRIHSYCNIYMGWNTCFFRYVSLMMGKGNWSAPVWQAFLRMMYKCIRHSGE